MWYNIATTSTSQRFKLICWTLSVVCGTTAGAADSKISNRIELESSDSNSNRISKLRRSLVDYLDCQRTANEVPATGVYFHSCWFLYVCLPACPLKQLWTDLHGNRASWPRDELIRLWDWDSELNLDPDSMFLLFQYWDWEAWYR